VTLDDATSAIYSAFLVEEEGTQSSFRGVAETIGRQGLGSLQIPPSRCARILSAPRCGSMSTRTGGWRSSTARTAWPLTTPRETPTMTRNLAA
jgi:hypothetical protein